MSHSKEKHMMAGALAASVSTVALYPLDLIKVRLQVFDGAGSRYKSLAGAFRSIVGSEGFTALYKGMTPGLAASVLSWGGYFYFYEQAKKRKLSSMPADAATAKLGTVDHLLAGVEAGAVMVNGEGQAQHYRGFTDAIRTILREEGPIGLYRGFTPALFLTSHGAIQFAFYEKTKVFVREFTGKDEGEQPAWVSMGLGGNSKIVAAMVTYPYQVVKSRLQQRDTEIVNKKTGKLERAPKYSGVFNCIYKMFRHEGPLSFFKGIVPNCLRVAPASAITFLVYEEALKVLGDV